MIQFISDRRGFTSVSIRLICIIRVLFFTLTANAQDFVWTPGLQRAYSDWQKLNVQPARRLMANEPSSTNGIRIFVDDFADMVTLLVSDDDKAFAKVKNREDARLDALRKLSDQSPWQRFAQAEVRLHWAFVKLKFGKEVSACWDVIRAYRLLVDNQKRFPDFLPTYKSLGTLHILIGSVPENYTWVTNLLGLQGTIRQGQQELAKAQQDPLMRTEAQLIDLLVRAYILKFTDADGRNLQELVRNNPDNLLIHFLAATTEQKNGHGAKALAYLAARPVGADYLPMPIIDNILGDIYLQQGQYGRASDHLRQFLRMYKGQNFLKDAYYKLFLCHWLVNQDDQARSYLQKVTTVGQLVVEADKAAQKFADVYFSKGSSPNQKTLMRARLASDGGFTDSALAYLRPYSEARFTLTAEKAEYNYRLGRIHQHRNEPEAAIPYLKRAISLSEAGQLSFGATASLQLGYIYQQKNDRDTARSYFQKALRYKNHEYKNSVDNKARAALNSL
ncbi:TPR repeat-containing protein [Fibrisoma limi BUZ 3]|uniref:TPR repeat-containing protein n=1 Tax=Fibrisoma limi BUZ 3 TaxID=1185876 RepID=I2GNX1_9BACT|nr:tetratricopeptide repeat protein [Fibrisoma limi]CCH55599.1 TPR repeat-containing protein [Fibrisoma limi BUZ 3]